MTPEELQALEEWFRRRRPWEKANPRQYGAVPVSEGQVLWLVGRVRELEAEAAVGRALADMVRQALKREGVLDVIARVRELEAEKVAEAESRCPECGCDEWHASDRAGRELPGGEMRTCRECYHTWEPKT